MWNKLMAALRTIENDQIAVLKDPAALEHLGDRWYVNSLGKMARMTALEREDLLAYCVRFRGWRGLLPLLLVESVINLAALMFYWVLPNTVPSVWPLLGLATLAGFFLFMAGLVSWFSYRELVSDRPVLRRWPLHFVVMAVSGVGSIWLLDLAQGKTMDGAYVRYLFGMGFWIVAAVSPIYAIAIGRNWRFERIQEERGIIERDRLAHALNQSQLRLLRAQIEPHFLFNTLGAVQQLAEQGAPKAAELTANLIAFLRSSLTEMQTEQVTLRTDFSLIEAYLKVMQARLGQRLRFQLELPEALAEVKVPCMLLLTLVENAIKHGIEPALRGGEIDVSAQRHGDGLLIRVRDTGAGMQSPAQYGHGLANLTKRIALAYAGKGHAALHLSSPDSSPDSDGGGVIADLTLPLTMNS